jgi:FlaA1/EpsC-like NDP-sugar epimerase
MRQILIIGAGRSASSLIQYLLNKSDVEKIHLVIDLSLALPRKEQMGIKMPHCLRYFDNEQRLRYQ